MRSVSESISKSVVALFAIASGLAWVAPVAAQGPAPEPEFRYHLMAELEVGEATGCSVQRGEQRWDRLQLRWEVHADRHRVRSISRYRCVAGAWALRESIEGGEAWFAQPAPGGDRFGWRIERSEWGGGAAVTLHVFAEDPQTGALDIAGSSEGWALATAALFPGGATAVPSLGVPALVLLLGLILFAAKAVLRTDRPSAERRASPSHALVGLCGFGLALLVSGGIRADSKRVTAIKLQPAPRVLLDASRDLFANEPAIDLLRVALSGEADSIRVELTVFDAQPPALPDRAKVLFVGSNLTSSNNLPGLFAAMAAQRGKDVQVASITFNGASLEDHFIKGEVLREIETGRYDLVVMQQGPSTLPENQQHLREWSERMTSVIRAAGAQPALLMVWPDASRAAFFNAASASYRSAAVAIDGWLFPAAETWRAAWREDPLLDLYANDRSNPSVLGSYAAAATLFAGLYRQSPEGLPASVQVDGHTLRLSDTVARILQRAAWQAHLRHGLTGR